MIARSIFHFSKSTNSAPRSSQVIFFSSQILIALCIDSGETLLSPQKTSKWIFKRSYVSLSFSMERSLNRDHCAMAFGSPEDRQFKAIFTVS